MSKGLVRRVAEEGVVSFLWSGVAKLFTVGWPYILMGLTMLSSLVGPAIAWPYVLMAAAVVFGMSAVGVLAFDQWLYRRTPANKLILRPVGIGWSAQKNTNGRYENLTSANVIVNFNNAATFPLTVSVVHCDVSLESRIPKERLVIRSMEMQPGTDGWFRAPLISFDNMPLKTLEGRLHFRIVYGRKGKLKFKHEDRLKLVVVWRDDQQNFIVHTSIDDAEPSLGTE